MNRRWFVGSPRFGALLLLLALFAAFHLSFKRPTLLYERPVALAELQSMVPDGVGFERRSCPIEHWEVSGKAPASALKARIVLSTDCCSTPGYNGPLQLFVVLDDQGRLQRVSVRSHRETPSYVESIFASGHLEQIVAVLGAQDSRVDALSFDGVSGATVSHRALVETIAACTEALSPSVVSVGIDAKNGPTLLVALSLFGLGASVAAWMTFGARLRFLAMGVGALLGSLGVFLSMEGIQRPLVQSSFMFRSNLAWWILFLGAFTFAIFRGRLFCGTLCPLGSLQELLGRFSKPLVNPGFASLRFPKYIIAAVVFLCFGWVARPELFSPDPIFLLLTLTSDPVAIGLLLLLLIAGCLVPRLWCRSFCPVGACLASCGAFAPAPIIVDDEACVHCLECLKLCPMDALFVTENGLLDVKSSECILCGICVRECPQQCIAPPKVRRHE